MEPLERDDYLKRYKARKFQIDEEKRILLALAVREGRIDLYGMEDEDFKKFKVKLKKDIREHHKLLHADEESEDEDLQKLEDKIYYGSDSESDYEDNASSPEEA
jgi:hypothetical protein